MYIRIIIYVNQYWDTWNRILDQWRDYYRNTVHRRF